MRHLTQYYQFMGVTGAAHDQWRAKPRVIFLWDRTVRHSQQPINRSRYENHEELNDCRPQDLDQVTMRRAAARLYSLLYVLMHTFSHSTIVSDPSKTEVTAFEIRATVN
jgi:hypothetical protein